MVLFCESEAEDLHEELPRGGDVHPFQHRCAVLPEGRGLASCTRVFRDLPLVGADHFRDRRGLRRSEAGQRLPRRHPAGAFPHVRRGGEAAGD